MNFQLLRVDFREDLFPDVNTPNRLFDGIPYKELPIFNIKATRNNTIISLTDFKGNIVVVYYLYIDFGNRCLKMENIISYRRFTHIEIVRY